MKIPVRLSVAVVCLILTWGLATPSSHQATTEAARERWNKEFSGPLPNLNRNANALLVSAVKGRTPGRALDLGVGEGRNAIYLARNGWSVTGVDLSEVAVGQAKQNAAANKAAISLHVGDLDVFDFGRDQWDLIVSTYMHGWHDRSKTNVAARIYDALKPGGLLVMEAYAKPEVAYGFRVDELARAYSRFQILKNESVNEAADWDRDNKRHIVRFVAQKQGAGSASAKPVDVVAKNTEPFNARVTDAASLKVEVEQRITRAREILKQLLQVQGPRTVDNTLQPYDDIFGQLRTAAGLSNSVASLHPDPAMRAVAETLRPSFQGLMAEINLRLDVYEALAAIDRRSIKDDVTTRYLERELEGFRLRGIDRPEPIRSRLQQLRTDLNAVQAEFQKNIREGNRTLQTTAAELEGVPRDFLARQKQDANGNITLTTNAIDIRPVLQFARSEDLRRRALVAWDNVAYPENAPVLQRMLATRSEIAKLLGFQNWAAYDAASRMTKDEATVSAFIDRIAKASEAKARVEYAQLLDRKRRDDPRADSVHESERFYYAELVRREQYDLDSQEVRQYFASDRVIAGVMDTAARMYGVTFYAVSVPLWHPSVRAFEMLEDGLVIGRFYLDLYPRAGKNASGASHMGVRIGSSRHTPESIIVAALSGGQPGDPGLMSHDEVRTLFHEFGHLVHSLFASRARWQGINGLPIEADATEVASMITEEWIWDAKTLQTFARHHKTGEPIPSALVARLRRAGEFGKAIITRFQIGLSKVALSYHDRDPGAWDPSALRREVMGLYAPFAPNADSHFEAAFGHLGNPLYASAYYGYTWSLVIAKDLFDRFDKNDLLATGPARRYRETVLAPGSSKPAKDLFEDFLGRPFSIDAWQRWLNEEMPPPSKH